MNLKNYNAKLKMEKQRIDGRWKMESKNTAYSSQNTGDKTRLVFCRGGDWLGCPILLQKVLFQRLKY